MTKLTHGGPGRGQGRKPKPIEEKYISTNLKLPPDLLKWLTANVKSGSKSKFIREAIREKIERIRLQ